MAAIPKAEVRFHPHSFADPDGRLFSWNGELYRGITASGTPLVRRLFENNLAPSLAERGLLIETTITPFHLAGFELVLHHRRVPFVSYPNEWCPAMLKAALLVEIDLVIELARHGLTIKDANPWNILVDDTRPVHVDFTSIVPMEDNTTWPTYDRFCRRCLYPLMLMAAGHELIARLLLSEDQGVTEALLLKLTNPGDPLKHFVQRARRSLGRRIRKVNNSPAETLVSIRQRIENVLLPHSSPPEAGGISDARQQGIEAEVVNKLLSDLKPYSALDLGSPGGQYARAASKAGCYAIYFNSDSARVTRLYSEACADRCKLLSLVMNIADPTPARGLANHASIAATERLACEMVLVPDLETIVTKTRLDLSRVVNGLADFSRRWVVFNIGATSAFELNEVLERKFSTINESPLQSGRRLFLCRL